MKRLSIAFAMVLLAYVLWGTKKAHAVEMSVDTLQSICTHPDPGSKNACRFFIYGVFEGASEAASELGNKTRFCLPVDLSARGMTDAVMLKIGEDLSSHPSDRQLSATSFVIGVMVASFPCQAGH